MMVVCICFGLFMFFFFKQKTADEVRISYWSSDVCSSDLMPGVDELPENERNRLMHISLPLSETVVLMASDILPSAGHTLTMGNSNYISLHPDSKEEADRLFNGLSAGGDIEMPMEDQFWGDYFGDRKSTRLNSSH